MKNKQMNLTLVNEMFFTFIFENTNERYRSVSTRFLNNLKNFEKDQNLENFGNRTRKSKKR